MIPKIIHYCWFGDNPKGEKEEKCIESWKSFCSDYEIIEWNETNVDLDMLPFVRDAYNAKKYAFVSDVIRLWALYNHGGIYFDTDVQVIKSFDDLLNCKGFIGFENDDYVNSGQCLASIKESTIIRDMFNYYKKINFINSDGTYNLLGCPIVNTNVLCDYGLIKNGEMQNIKDFIIFPSDYFNPYEDATGKLYITENTYSIHWYAKSWLDKKIIYRSRMTKAIRKIFGKNSLLWIKKLKF